jgi:hypothetical protein
MVQITYKLAKSSPVLRAAFGLTGSSADLKREITGTNVFDRVLTLKRKVDNSDLQVVTQFTHKIADREIDGKTQRAADVASNAADEAMTNFFIWTGRNFLSGQQTGIMQAALYNAGVVWKPLSTKYVLRKARLGLSTGFWRFSNKLYRQFISANSKRRGLFGGTKVAASTKGFVATMKVTLAPQLGALTTTQSLEKQILDAGFGGNEEMVRKLQGKLEYYRPLLGPALAFYINNVVKTSVVNALAKAGFRLKRVKSTGGVQEGGNVGP